MFQTCISISFIVVLASCSGPDRENVRTEPSFQISDSSISVSESCFSNPVLINGSSIGELTQQLYKQGNWPELIKFISDSSIQEFGEENIISSFQRTDFGYEIQLKSMSVFGEGQYLLNYHTWKFGTKGILRMGIVIENDTAKIVIKQINPTIQFDDSDDGTQIPYFGC